MGTVHLVGGEKGGVGKSVMARLLAQYMIDHEIPFIGFDTDRSHGALLRFYSDFAAPTIIDDYQSMDAIIEMAAGQSQQRILVDLAAQTHLPLLKWLGDSGVIDLANELGIRLCYWNVMDSGKDCVDLLAKLFDQFENQLNYVLVQNQLRDEEFTLLESSGLKARALALNASMMSLKRLYPALMTKIDSHSLSFWAAKNKQHDSLHNLGLLDRQRVKVWLTHAYQGIASVGV